MYPARTAQQTRMRIQAVSMYQVAFARQDMNIFQAALAVCCVLMVMPKQVLTTQIACLAVLILLGCIQKAHHQPMCAYHAQITLQLWGGVHSVCVILDLQQWMQAFLIFNVRHATRDLSSMELAMKIVRHVQLELLAPLVH